MWVWWRAQGRGQVCLCNGGLEIWGGGCPHTLSILTLAHTVSHSHMDVFTHSNTIPSTHSVFSYSQPCIWTFSHTLKPSHSHT